jgi:hypothetical protein
MVVRLGLAHHSETRTPLSTGALLEKERPNVEMLSCFCSKRVSFLQIRNDTKKFGRVA